MLQTSRRSIFEAEQEGFCEPARRFVERQFSRRLMAFEAAGIMDRAFWKVAGDAGLHCSGVPEALGGLGLDSCYNAIIDEEMSSAGVSDCLKLPSEVTTRYMVRYGSDEQKTHWLPRMAPRDTMTEPGPGSDLQGVRATAARDGYPI